MSSIDTPHLDSLAPIAVDYDPFAGSALARVVPTMATQREIWLAASLEDAASLAYNESISLYLQGDLYVESLQAALKDLVDRHEALRASFGADGQELYIAAQRDMPCPLRDLAMLDDDARSARIRAVLERAVTTPFDLEHGPLARAELLRLAPREHLLVFTAHHIVCDGWSFGVIVRDLAQLYALHQGHGPAPAPADSFAAFALREAARSDSDSAHEDQRYWLQQFDRTPAPLDLPTDHARPRQRSFASRREDRMLDATLVGSIKRMGASRGASLYAVLLSAFGVLLQRVARQEDLVIGIPSAGQASGDHHALVGHCVNVLPLRMIIDPAQSFATVLDSVRSDLLDAFEHQQYTLGSLLERLPLARDPGRLPLVSVLFNLDQALDQSTLSFPNVQFQLTANPRRHENFELFVNAVQVDGGLRLECQYNSDLWERATIESWLDAYECLLHHAASAPDTPARMLPMVSPAAAAVLESLQPAPTAYPAGRLAHEYFEAQVDCAPSRMAVRYGAAQLSYTELEQQANRLAHTLRSRGIGRGALVGLSLDRGTDMLAAVLAVLKSGAGYVPLDPAFPADRLAFMCEDAALSALIVDGTMPSALTLPAAQVISLACDASSIMAASSGRLPRDGKSALPASVAYLIYTSGSTGRPKGVQVPHRATSNFLSAMQQATGITQDDRLLAVTTLSFDIAFLELMLPLSVGAETIIASYDDVRDSHRLRQLVEGTGASMMQATPSGWRILAESGWQGSKDLRAIVGGEPLPADLAQQMLTLCGKVWNAYGPTETTVWSSLWPVADPLAGIFIGRPIANTSIHVLDEQGAPCPLGVPGEIHIGGEGVALGYLNRPELTAACFLNDPFAASPGACIYRTGDRGRWLANGQLEHLGRVDFQVKLRGYRIELGEIEAVLGQQPGILRSVVITREDRPGDVRLVAYVVCRTGVSLDEQALRAQLQQLLPDYMLPQHLVPLEAIPLLPNGKIDRKSLPMPSLPAAGPDHARQRPQGITEQRVAKAMETVLALPELDVHDDFFALGGHSLLAAQLTARLNREFDITLSFRTLFDAPTIAMLAKVIEQQLASGPISATPAIQHRFEQDRAPLSLMQQRLWSLEALQPGRVSYNEPSAHRLRGPLDEVAFECAFQALMQRQPIMRTAFRAVGETVEQVVDTQLEIWLFPAEDLSDLPADRREAVLMQRLQKLTDIPFDLTRAPLFSARMFRLAKEEHVLFFMPHHIIWDGWSFDILYAELSQLYCAFTQRAASPLPPLPVTYGDFSEWHAKWLEGPQFQAQLAFWRERLTQVAQVGALPTDHPRRPGMAGAGRTEWIHVSAAGTDALHEVGRLADATLNMTLLALYYVLLGSIAGQRELVIGTPVRGRNQTEVESVMGYFNNLVPLHMTLDPAMPFVEFVGEVKRCAIESFGHPDVPLEYLQRELKVAHRGGTLLYQALFSFQDARQRASDWGGLEHEQILLFQSGATEDLGLWFLEGRKGMVGGVTYNADILEADTACQLRQRYLSLMAAVSEDPRQSIAALHTHVGGPMSMGNAASPAKPVLPPEQPASVPAPGTATERMLVALWSELLGKADIRCSDNFFDVGGHSLMAVEMASRVKHDTGVQLNLLDIANGTLGTLAAGLAEMQASQTNQPETLGARLRHLFGRR